MTTMVTTPDWAYITLEPNTELKMVFDCVSYWCYESDIDYGSVGYIPEQWVGPDIHNNIITNTGLSQMHMV